MDIHREIVRIRTVSTIALILFIPTVNIFAIITDVLIWMGSDGDRRNPLKSAGGFSVAAVVWNIAVLAGCAALRSAFAGSISDTFFAVLAAVNLLSAAVSILIIAKTAKITANIPEDKPFFD